MIVLKNVCKRYGANEVLKNVSLQIGEGEFVSVRGKSGAGKTTLLKILGLLEEADEGEVNILGQTISRLNDEQKSFIRLHFIGFIFQFFNLIPTLTVIENIELPLALAGKSKKERRERAIELLKHFNLANLAQRFPETLSGGERQRIATIRALANNPKIILADEPTSNLDDENSKLLIELLKSINREKKVTIILTTTDLYEKLPTHKDFMLKDGCIHEMH
jgi:putative ABC transport system ATP-binding protein